jgi:hypothetical protein
LSAGGDDIEEEEDELEPDEVELDL